MPKYVKTVIKKSILIPWLNETVFGENSSFLTNEEKQLRQDALAEAATLPGYLGQNCVQIGNTEIFTYEFDTEENLKNFVNKTQDKGSELYDENMAITKYGEMKKRKVRELNLVESFQATTSIDLN
jgi:hypothetical protein